MADYEPVPLDAVCNAGVDVFGDDTPNPPIGPVTLRGLPFVIGSETLPKTGVWSFQPHPSTPAPGTADECADGGRPRAGAFRGSLWTTKLMIN